MSAFIISEETMHRVVHAFDKHGDIRAMNCESLDRLGERLYALNNAAIVARYGEPDDVPAYQYRPLGNVPAVHMYKALDCLIYQCSEGDVPDLPDFKMLTCLRAKLAMVIVDDLPDYQSAPWDSGWPAPPSDKEANTLRIYKQVAAVAPDLVPTVAQQVKTGAAPLTALIPGTRANTSAMLAASIDADRVAADLAEDRRQAAAAAGRRPVTARLTTPTVEEEIF